MSVLGRHLFGELSKSMKMISLTTFVSLVVLSVIGYFIYKQFFSPLSKFKEYSKKAIDDTKTTKDPFIVLFNVPKTASNDQIAKIIVDYNKSNPVTKIDGFITSKSKDEKVTLLVSFDPTSGYNKDKLPPLIDDNDTTIWILK